MLAPVALFVYARPEHTQRTVEALLKNLLAEETDVIVFSDAAKGAEKEQAVAAVREYVSGVKGFKSLTVHYRPHNYGLEVDYRRWERGRSRARACDRARGRFPDLAVFPDLYE